jgi:hypothetical protein
MSKMRFFGPGGPVFLAEVELELDDGTWLLRGWLDAETWARVDAAAAFGLTPEGRGPSMFGPIPAGVRVRVEAAGDADVTGWLDGRDTDTGLDLLERAPDSHVLRSTEAWPARNVTWEYAPGVLAGFSVTHTPPGVVLELRAAVAAGRSPLTVLDDNRWETLLEVDRAVVNKELLGWAQRASDADRDTLLDWLDNRPMVQDLVSSLLVTWPAWVQARAARVVNIACRPVGSWMPEQHGLVERRLTEGNGWSAWVTYLINSHIRECPAAIAEALSRGAHLDPDALRELAASVTGWAKEQLGDVTRAMARGGPVATTAWRLQLLRRLKPEDPRWAEIDAALETPYPTVIPNERPWD